MVIEVLNLAKCIKKFDNIGNIDVMPQIIDGTYRVEARAKELAPVYGQNHSKAKPPLSKYVIVGALREAIHSTFDKVNKFGIVFCAIEYAIYQEFGTKYQSGTPFLNPAVKIEKAGIYKRLSEFITSELKKQSK